MMIYLCPSVNGVNVIVDILIIKKMLSTKTFNKILPFLQRALFDQSQIFVKVYLLHVYESQNLDIVNLMLYYEQSKISRSRTACYNNTWTGI